jgi:hypothetical protein
LPRARRKAETAARARETGNHERVCRRMSGPFTGCREIARHAIAPPAPTQILGDC